MAEEKPEEEAGSVATEEAESTTPESESKTPELEAGPAGLALVHHAPEHAHPSPVRYVGIAILLAVITGLEVALYYIQLPSGLLVFLLLVLAVMKFALVAAFFMHLKFDSPMLRRVFITGIVLAGTVYTVALLTVGVLI